MITMFTAVKILQAHQFIKPLNPPGKKKKNYYFFFSAFKKVCLLTPWFYM